MTLPYIWANVQPLKWLLNNLNIDMAGKANGSVAGQTEMVTMASVKVGKGGGTLVAGGLNGRLMGLLHLLLQPTQPNPT